MIDIGFIDITTTIRNIKPVINYTQNKLISLFTNNLDITIKHDN